MADAREGEGQEEYYKKEFLKPSFLKGFIDAYRSFPCLWKKTSKEYSNLRLKKNAYEKLVTLSKEVNPNTNVDWVKTRIQNLRTVFLKEFKKVESSKKSGSDTEDIYMPKLWYFNILMFTADQEKPRKSVSSIQEDDDALNNISLTSAPVTDRNEEELETLEKEFEQEHTTRNTDSPQSVELFKKPEEKRKKKHKEEIDKEATNKELLMDKYDAYAIIVAAKLRKMDSDQYILAELHINNILYSGLMGRLNEGNSYPCTSCQYFSRMYQAQQHYPYTPQTSPSTQPTPLQQYQYTPQTFPRPQPTPLQQYPYTLQIFPSLQPTPLQQYPYIYTPQMIPSPQPTPLQQHRYTPQTSPSPQSSPSSSFFQGSIEDVFTKVL